MRVHRVAEEERVPLVQTVERRVCQERKEESQVADGGESEYTGATGEIRRKQSTQVQYGRSEVSKEERFHRMPDGEGEEYTGAVSGRREYTGAGTGERSTQVRRWERVLQGADGGESTQVQTAERGVGRRESTGAGRRRE
uniref:Uncharacterized protein n=1 Tax=Knipowitschia caucasica TaxID=637954 RepID=A0AAV2JRK9_KNICA